MVNKEPKKKRHHYVPRFILRNFSQDDRTISLFVLASRNIVGNASIRDQCYENYFYGKRKEIENGFADDEGYISQILHDLSPLALENLSKEALVRLLLFTFFQIHRTKATAEITNILTGSMMKHIASLDPRLDDIDLSNWEFYLNFPQMENLFIAICNYHLILDLQLKFIINNRKIGFVIGDSPVSIYNQWAEHHSRFLHYKGYCGHALKGIQWFFPLSPSVCLAAFDNSTYQYGSPRKRICLPSSRDVLLINFLQALYADKCIYFDPNRIEESHLHDLSTTREHHPALGKPHFSIYERDSNDNETSEHLLLFERGSDPRLGSQFNFVQVIDKNSYTGYNRITLPIRSQELFNYSRQFSSQFKKKIEQEKKKLGIVNGHSIKLDSFPN